MKTEEQRTLCQKIDLVRSCAGSNQFSIEACGILAEICQMAQAHEQTHAALYRVIESLGGELSIDLKWATSLRIGNVCIVDNPQTDRIDFYAETPAPHDDE